MLEAPVLSEEAEEARKKLLARAVTWLETPSSIRKELAAWMAIYMVMGAYDPGSESMVARVSLIH